jgi:molecular chaperone IbpA
MRTFDISPLYRSTVGFDRLFDLLENNAPRSEWPPYNIEKKSENEYSISMAIAGFGSDEIELTQTGNTLLVAGQKKEETGKREMLHRGIAFRSFRQTFNLADHVKVASAELKNGLLSVELVREIPEQLKPRRINIGAAQSASALQDNQPVQVEHNPGEAKAA